MRVACLNYRTDGRIYIGCGEAEHDVMSALQVALISYFPNLERKDLGKELKKKGNIVFSYLLAFKASHINIILHFVGIVHVQHSTKLYLD